MRERTGYLATGFAQSGNAEIADGTIVSIILIRHGATAGNAEKRYIGARTDEPLSEEGKRQLTGLKTQRPELSQCKEADGRRHGLNNSKIDSSQCIQGLESDGQQLFVLQFRRLDRLYASPMRRCLETADILFDGQKVRTIENFRETDFGAFEGKNYMELSGDPAYQAWIDSNGEMAFPGGESREAFIRRSVEGFREMVQDIESHIAQDVRRTRCGTESFAGRLSKSEKSAGEAEALDESAGHAGGAETIDTANAGEAETPDQPTEPSVFRAAAVVHGGTIMAVLQSLFGGDYYSYHVGNGEGYTFFLERREERWVPCDLRRMTTCRVRSREQTEPDRKETEA